MEENKSILADGVSVGEEYDGSAPAADMTEAPDVAPVTESDTDPAAMLREAGDTINRAAKEAESFKRRRAETGYADPTDDEKKREAELKRLAEEEKRREDAAEEKRAALEYAESYRARIRTERENAAARKKEEERARARAEEKALREREIAEDIEREREAARERSARSESLLERFGDKVGASSDGELSADAFFAEAKADLPIKVEATGTDPVSGSDTVGDGIDTPVSSVFEHGDEKNTDSESEIADASDAGTTVSEVEDSDFSAVEERTADAEGAEDYVITLDGGHSERDLLYIEGAVACEIAIGVADTDAIGSDVGGYSSTTAPAASEASVTPSITADIHVPPASSIPYEDFPGVPESTVTESVDPVVGDTEKSFEEESELIRHSKEIAEADRAKREEKPDEVPVYPDPEPELPKKRGRKTKAEREEERRALLEFERDSRSRKPFGERAKTADDRAVDELEDEESVRRDTAAVEVGDSTTRTENTDTLEAKPVFDKKSLLKNKARQVKNDLLLIEHRIYNDIRRLEMDTRTGAISFTAKIEDEKTRRARGRKKTALANTRKKLKVAKRFETADNERYYYLTLTDVNEVKLPKSTDREEVRDTREQLLALLKRRDDLNLKLIELYSLSEGGKGNAAEGRFKAVLKAKKTAYKKQIPSFRKYEKARLSTADKEKLYPLLDERTELYGELARVNYSLKKEKAKGLAKKELRRERARITRKLNENRQAILHYERKALRRAETHTEKSRNSVLAWSALAVLAIGTVLAVVFWNQLQPWLVGTALPWLGDAVTRLVGWVMSLIAGGASDAPVQ